jgi:hypothetical protein
MPCAYTGQAARNNFATLGNEALQQANIAVGDSVDLLGAELADLLAPEELASARAASARTACGTWRTWSAGARTGWGGMRVRAAQWIACWFRQP